MALMSPNATTRACIATAKIRRNILTSTIAVRPIWRARLPLAPWTRFICCPSRTKASATVLPDADSDEYQGEFWIAESPDRRARGVLTRKRGTNAVVDLDASLRDGPQLGTQSNLAGGGIAITYRLHTPTESVASFQPATLHGLLDDGTPVTGLAAQNHGGDGELGMMPQYHLRYLLWGTHTLDDAVFRALRFRIYGFEMMTRIWAESAASHPVTYPGLQGNLSPPDRRRGYLVGLSSRRASAFAPGD